VGADVVDAFCSQRPEATAAFVATRPGKWHADLYLLARQRLAACGVHQVAGGDACTLQEPRRFFSHRRDADPRRMASVIYRS
jgi:copper oxidase (laccase) domain-containing protein